MTCEPRMTKVLYLRWARSCRRRKPATPTKDQLREVRIQAHTARQDLYAAVQTARALPANTAEEKRAHNAARHRRQRAAEIARRVAG
jgi:hypothetical protein